MKHQEILNLLNEGSGSELATRKWNIAIGQSNASYDAKNETIYNTEVLKSNLCNSNDAHILTRGNIHIIKHNVIQVAFENCAPFIYCITKIDDAEDLDLDMLMYNSLKYSSN